MSVRLGPSPRRSILSEPSPKLLLVFVGEPALKGSVCKTLPSVSRPPRLMSSSSRMVTGAVPLPISMGIRDPVTTTCSISLSACSDDFASLAMASLTGLKASTLQAMPPVKLDLLTQCTPLIGPTNRPPLALASNLDATRITWLRP